MGNPGLQDAKSDYINPVNPVLITSNKWYKYWYLLRLKAKGRPDIIVTAFMPQKP